MLGLSSRQRPLPPEAAWALAAALAAGTNEGRPASVARFDLTLVCGAEKRTLHAPANGVEILAVARGRQPIHLPVIPGFQVTAARLVAGVLMITAPVQPGRAHAVAPQQGGHTALLDGQADTKQHLATAVARLQVVNF